MNISRENISELSATITLKIEKADYAEAVEKTLKDYRKKVNMPGFRPGNVPVGLVKKQYGVAITAEEVNRIISEEINKFVEAEKINMLGEPLPNEEKQKEISWENQEDFEFVFDIAWAPEFEVKLDKRKKYSYYQIDVSESMIDKQVSAFTQRMGSNVPVDVAEEKDILRVDIESLTGEPVSQNVAIAIDLMKDDSVKSKAVGSKVGDVMTFDPMKVYQNKYEVANILNVPQKEAKDLEEGVEYTFKVVQVMRFQEAELTDEFFEAVLGPDSSVKTVAEFRAKLKSDIVTNYEQSSEYKFMLDVKEALQEKVEFNLPEEFLKRWLLVVNKNLTPASLDEQFDSILKDFRWQLIRDHVAKENEVAVEYEDVLAVARKVTVMQFFQYGMGNVSEDLLENYAVQMLQDDQTRNRMMNQAYEEKVVAVIKEKVAIEDKLLSEEEFQKLFEAV
ncbi:MAG: trigger factor [Mangrovibacterium sp.]